LGGTASDPEDIALAASPDKTNERRFMKSLFSLDLNAALFY
jgi:hypothetical protein